MTASEFVRKVRDIARQHQRPVFAVDFEPMRDEIRLTFRFKAPRP